jgi:hypothetical protein
VLAGAAAGRGGSGASALRSQAPVLPCYQRLEVFGGMGHSVAIAGCEHGAPLTTCASWQHGLLERGHTCCGPSSACHCGARAGSGGVVDEHGVAVCCAKMDGALRTCHGTANHTIARSAVDEVDAGFRVEVGVYGVFTRALREAAR